MPNLDKLAQRSVIFQNAFTSVSSCSPSRSTILSGLPQHQNGMYGLHHPPHHFTSFSRVLSLPKILSASGVKTGIVGKKHVGPKWVYKFDYEQTEEEHNLMQIGRNITFMNHFVRAFLQDRKQDQKPFMLYIGLFDPHRDFGMYGPFAEKFGNGEPGMGVIQDWKPTHYKPGDVEVPYYVPDTPTARLDIAAQYTTYSRMDQGIGLFLNELKEAGFEDNTLVIYTSDNGIPFPNAKTNLYDSGMREPMLISSPNHPENWGQNTSAMASLLDIMPTILDWFSTQRADNTRYPDDYNKSLTGKSLLPVTANPGTTGYDVVFSSHNFHEVTMSYPMRSIRNRQYQLIHNMFFPIPYPIADDIFMSPTFAEMMNRTAGGRPLKWFKTLKQYYYRSQWELYDIRVDPRELQNLVNSSDHRTIFNTLKANLLRWQNVTSDPWICLPWGALWNGKCASMHNGNGF